MRRPPTVPVVLAGFAAFLDLYATQPILPLLAGVFDASPLLVSLTITVPTLAVAAASPVVGRLADHIGLRRVIVGSAFALAVATMLAATATTLTQLIAWRLVQGLLTPGVFAVAMAYIHHEWPPSHVGRATAAYVSGTVVGGFSGRALAGTIAGAGHWRGVFVVLAIVNLLVAIALWAKLPIERQVSRAPTPRRSPFVHLRNPQLVATYAVGFCVLCAQVAMFTYIPFHLSAPPFNLSAVALGWLFAVYLVGAVVTPFSGHWIDRYGHRTGLALAIALGASGALLTLASSLPIVIVGLSVFATAVFIAQASATSHVGANAAHDRGLAIGLYSSFYYLGGSAGGAVPALAWSRTGWLGCVAFIVLVQLTTLAIALTTWSGQRGSHVEPEPT